MKKVCGVLGVLLLGAAFLALPAPARAEMYVEGYIGGVGATGLGTSASVTSPNFPGFSASGNLPGDVNASVIGGLKIGTWFVPTGFLGYNYPDWMKYFGFYTDFSYHRLDVRQKQFTGTAFVGAVPIGSASIDFESEGSVATWAFMFAARYGFFQDSEVPFGRLQPYVAVGPAVMWSTQQPKILSTAFLIGHSPDSQGSTNIALAVDAGVRYMCLKNVSIDLSFKYRYAAPSFDHSGRLNLIVGGVNVPVNYKVDPTYNLLSGQLGVAYHF